MTLVRLEMQGEVGVIRLDRPPVNAINAEMHRQLIDIAGRVAQDRSIRAVVLYGGERAFAAGADIREMAELNSSQIGALIGSLNEAVNSVARLPQPVIAAVTGFALGGGCELALAADFRFVADNARLGLPEITLGVIPGAGGTQRLPRIVGVTTAKELIYTGRAVDGAEAVRIGLASRSLLADQVLPEAMAFATRLAAGATVALAAAKRVIDDGLEEPLPAAVEMENRRFAELFATEDQRIGMTSFLEHGPGQAGFVGR